MNKKIQNLENEMDEPKGLFKHKKGKRKTYLLFKEAPLQILLTLIKEGDEVYMSKLIRDSKLAYSNAYYTLKTLEMLKFIEVHSVDNYKIVKLTEKGRRLVELINQILLLTGE